MFITKLAIVVAVGLSQPVAAWASQVQVSPTRIILEPGAAVGLVTLTNTGREVVRFEVDVVSWDESPEGQMVLAPTEDLVVFPRMIEVAPGQARPVRVASRVPLGRTQRSYRVFVSELPAPHRAPRSIRVLSRFGVPVFVGPLDQSSQVAVASVQVARDGELRLVLENRGSGFAFVRKIEARSPLGEQQWAGWYLLGDRHRVYRAPLGGWRGTAPGELEVRIELEDGSVVEQRIAVAP